MEAGHHHDLDQAILAPFGGGLRLQRLGIGPPGKVLGQNVTQQPKRMRQSGGTTGGNAVDNILR